MSVRTRRGDRGPRRRSFTVDDPEAEQESFENIPRLPERRRYTCPRCQSMFGTDISESEARFGEAVTRREPVGTPLSSFVSREELQEHIARVHGGQRLPSAATRKLGRTPPKQTESQTEDDDGGDILGSESEKESLIGADGDNEEVLGSEEGGILDEGKDESDSGAIL